MNRRLLVSWQIAYQQNQGRDDGGSDRPNHDQPANGRNPVSASRMGDPDKRGEHRKDCNQ